MKNILFVVFFIFISCKDKYGSWVQLQPALKFSISDSNTLFRLYPKDSIKMNYYAEKLIYYDSSGIKKKMNYVIIGRNDKNDDPKYHISIGNIAEKSSLENIKMYYIHWQNGEIDTLYADYKRVHASEINNYTCKCNDPLVELKLNGKTYIRKTNYDINGIYIFNR